jgi:DNA-binding transcriptional LysR family regulator
MLHYLRGGTELPALEQLQALAEAVRGPTFAAAAARLRVSPSALSQQLRGLEARLGVRLFEAVGRLRRPTPAATRFALELRGHLDGLAEAAARLAQAHEEVRGTIRLGGPGPFSRRWLRPRLAALLRAHAALRVEVRFEVPSVLVRAINAGELDLAILASAPQEGGLELRALCEEEFQCFAAPELAAGLSRSPTATALRSQRWIAFDRDLAMHATWWRAAFGRREPFPEEVVCYVTSLDEMMELCAAGCGLTVLPGYFAEGALRARRLVELRPPRLGRAGSTNPNTRLARNTLSLAWRRGAVESAVFRTVRDALLRPGS